MEWLDVDKMKCFSPVEPVKKELAVTESFKLLLLCFEPDQAVPPCKMVRHTAFYIVEGKGTVVVENEGKPVSKGSIVLIPSNLERQIRAETRLIVLAMQYSESSSKEA